MSGSIVLDGIGPLVAVAALLLLGRGKRFNDGEFPKLREENGIEFVCRLCGDMKRGGDEENIRGGADMRYLMGNAQVEKSPPYRSARRLAMRYRNVTGF